MKILDYLFYIALCIIAGIGLLVCNINEDMYFRLPHFDGVQKHEIYEKEQWEIQANSIVALDIAQIDPSRYLISYLDSTKNGGSVLHGTLFYPNKYSVTMQKGSWQNIATNTKIHSIATPLFNSKTLAAQTGQLTATFNTALTQAQDSKLFVFVNANITRKLPLQRSYILHTSIEDIATYIEGQDTKAQNHNKDSQAQQAAKEGAELKDTAKSESTSQSQHTTDSQKPPLFQLHEQPALSIVANLNSFLSHKPTTLIDAQDEAQGSILPFQTSLKNNIAFFAIFDEKLHLQEILKPHDNPNYTNPLITPLHTNYALNTKSNDTSTHHCLAVYHAPTRKTHTQDSNKDSSKDSNIAYQTCKMSNGVLQFDELQESSLQVGNALSLATFGNYVVLLYTKNKDSTLNLAVWNGADFIPLKELDRNTKGRIISPNVFIHGAYMYVVYVKESQHIMNALTLNEVFIDNLIAQQGALEGGK